MTQTPLMTETRLMRPTRWYQQFWPWFLIVLPGVVVIASLITLGIAIKYADAPVQGDYEKHGLTVLHKNIQNKTVPQKTAVRETADDRTQH